MALAHYQILLGKGFIGGCGKKTKMARSIVTALMVCSMLLLLPTLCASVDTETPIKVVSTADETVEFHALAEESIRAASEAYDKREYRASADLLLHAATRVVGHESEWRIQFNLAHVHRANDQHGASARAAERSIALGAKCVEAFIMAAEGLKFEGDTTAATSFYLRVWQATHAYTDGPLRIISCADDPRLFHHRDSVYVKMKTKRDFTTTSILKLAHDIDQLKYLAATQGVNDPMMRSRIETLSILAEEIGDFAPDPYIDPFTGPDVSLPCDTSSQQCRMSLRRDRDPIVNLPPEWQHEIGPYYNRVLHVVESPPVEAALNPEIDAVAIQARYKELRSAEHAHSHIVHVDDFLTPEAMKSLRKFCLESTIWYHVKNVGYLGAYWGNGFASPLLLQIADELRSSFPEILKDYPLHQMWAFKYDSNISSGIKVHADDAVVNVNFWITPEDVNLGSDANGDGGGIRVYLKHAPEEWSYLEYNGDVFKGYRHLAGEKGGANRHVTIPYKQNRAVIFHSKLFHNTEKFEFRCCGYKDRRINITMLFGSPSKRGRARFVRRRLMGGTPS